MGWEERSNTDVPKTSAECRSCPLAPPRVLPNTSILIIQSLFAKYIYNLPINIHGISQSFMAFHSHSWASTEQWTIWATSAHISSWDWMRLAPSFSSYAVNNNPFYALSFCSFVYVISLFKIAWGLVLKCYLRFLCARRPSGPSGESRCVRWASFRHNLQCHWPWIQCYESTIYI